SLRLAVCGRQAARELQEVAREDSGANGGVRCHEQRTQAAWIQVRGINHLLCLYAGGRDGERSRRGMLLLQNPGGSALTESAGRQVNRQQTQQKHPTLNPCGPNMQRVKLDPCRIFLAYGREISD